MTDKLDQEIKKILVDFKDQLSLWHTSVDDSYLHPDQDIYVSRVRRLMDRHTTKTCPGLALEDCLKCRYHYTLKEAGGESFCALEFQLPINKISDRILYKEPFCPKCLIEKATTLCAQVAEAHRRAKDSKLHLGNPPVCKTCNDGTKKVWGHIGEIYCPDHGESQ